MRWIKKISVMLILVLIVSSLSVLAQISTESSTVQQVGSTPEINGGTIATISKCVDNSDCASDKICIENYCLNKREWFLKQMGIYYDQAQTEGSWLSVIGDMVSFLKEIF